MRIVVGLGNPGPDYAGTRHNAGFMVLDALHSKLSGGSWSKKFRGELAEVRDASLGDDGRLLLLKPLTFMNLSGECVRPAADFYKVSAPQVLVVHDELDLPLGTLRVKVGGGHGGHNGLRSLHQHLGQDYVRVRLGVGRPEAKGSEVINHVLSGFKKQERDEFDRLVADAADAVLLWLRQGAQAAMNRYNRDPKAEKPAKPEKLPPPARAAKPGPGDGAA